MLNQDQLKVAQRALDFYLEHNREDLTVSETQTAQSAYQGLDQLIDGDVIASIWTVEDVYSIMFEDAEDQDYEMNRGHTDTEIQTARQVLRNAERNHNAEYGINWDTLRAELEAIQEDIK